MHPRISVSSICFLGQPIADVVRAWDELDARRVSLVSPQVLGADLPALRETFKHGDRKLETMTHMFLGDLSAEPREELWRKARASLNQVVDIAAELGGRSIYMLTGGFGALTWEEAAERFSAAIEPCIAHARNAGIALAIENTPPVYADIHIGHSLRDTLTLAEQAGIGVCIDLPTCWTEAGLKATIERAIPRCPIVQLSDYALGDRGFPARAVPGDGAIQLKRVVKWMLDAGYQGVFDLELLGPRIEKEGRLAAARRSAENLGKILSELGA